MNSKNYSVVCYSESCNIQESLEELILCGNCKAYAYILHDKDIDSNGNIKKPRGSIVGPVSNWSDFFGSLVLVPVNYFRQFLSFDLFGKTLFLVLCGVITILVAIWLVKKFK